MTGTPYTELDRPVLADEAAVAARKRELQQIYNGPIPRSALPISVATARATADAQVKIAREAIRDHLRAARSWWLSGQRDQFEANRGYARLAIAHYRAVKAWRDDYVAGLPVTEPARGQAA